MFDDEAAHRSTPNPTRRRSALALHDGFVEHLRELISERPAALEDEKNLGTDNERDVALLARPRDLKSRLHFRRCIAERIV
jgi:hypothetical protein